MFYDENMRRDFHPKHEEFIPQKARETALGPNREGMEVPPAWIMNIPGKFPSAHIADYEIYNFTSRD